MSWASDGNLVLAYLLCVSMALIVCIPICARIWGIPGLRRCLWNHGCAKWVTSCDTYIQQSMYHSHTELQSLEEGGATPYCQQPDRETTLQLASWREDVQNNCTGDTLTIKLEHIQFGLKAPHNSDVVSESVGQRVKGNRDETATESTANNEQNENEQEVVKEILC